MQNLAPIEPVYIEGDDLGFLLIHSFTGTPLTYQRYVNYLAAAGHTISVPLLKGHGTEPADLIGVSHCDWMAQMEEALEQLQKKCSRVFVVGLSMGATLALHLAEHNHMISGIILINVMIDLPSLREFYESMEAADIDQVKGFSIPLNYDRRMLYKTIPVSALKEVTLLTERVQPKIQNVIAPLLIFTSSADIVVSSSNSKRILNEASSNIKSYISLIGSHHFVFCDTDFERMVEMARIFIYYLSHINTSLFIDFDASVNIPENYTFKASAHNPPSNEHKKPPYH